MACRIGMTQDLARRKGEWKEKHPGLYDWTHESTHYSKSAAQAEETRLASARGCESGHGGSGPEQGTWYVYSFKY